MNNTQPDSVVKNGTVGSITPAKKLDDQNIDEFAHLLEHDTEANLRTELSMVSVGIETGYTIGEVDLAFPGGAISIIAAPTSHGKTTALINFSLGVLKENSDKNVYFFSHEESKASITLSFMSVWIGAELSKNNRSSLEHFFRGTADGDKYIKQEQKELFMLKKERFFAELINTGRLKIHYSEMTADKLVEAINYIKERDPKVGLICIDYMQLLKLAKPARTARQEELKQICLMLNECAVKTGLPIVLAAQFNRSVVAEADLSPVQIGEAGDIERIASLIIGIFNRSFDAMSRTGNINRKGEAVPKEQTLYVEVLKGRKIGNSHNCVMKFDGNTGVITKGPKALKDCTHTNARAQSDQTITEGVF